MNRRNALKVLSALPLVTSLPALAQMSDPKKPAPAPAAKANNMLDENDTLAKAMQYKADAAKAPAMRTNKQAFCYNCAKYNICMTGDTACKPLDKAALAKADAAPCQIFKAKLVAKSGWCLSWQAMG